MVVWWYAGNNQDGLLLSVEGGEFVKNSNIMTSSTPSQQSDPEKKF